MRGIKEAAQAKVPRIVAIYKARRFAITLEEGQILLARCLPR